MKRYSYTVYIACMILALSGCSSKNRPVDIYTLKYTTTLNFQASSTSTKSLKIATPRSTREIKSDNILYAPTPSQRERYAYSRWSDTPNHMLESYLVALLDNSHIFSTVLPATSTARSNLLLESTIEDFYHLVEGEKSFGIIKIRFYLIDEKSKKVISDNLFSSKAQAATVDAKGAAEALHGTLGEMEKELVDWLKTAR